MKVLFVASGNSDKFETAPFIRAQAESLQREGIEVEFYRIRGKGIRGYLKNIPEIRRTVKKINPDLIHVHYALSAVPVIAAFTGKPLVISFMGSDVYGEYIGENKVKKSSAYLTLTAYLVQPFAAALISKSSNIEKYVYRKSISHILPNGIDLDRFRCSSDTKKAEKKPEILFLGNPENKRKNFRLASEAAEKLSSEVKLTAPYPVSHQEVVEHLCSCDVFVITAFQEGSPNVVKEAMACNCPMVVTDVGDVREVIGDTPGCYISSFDTDEFARKLKLAIHFAKTTGRTNGRERIMKLGLDEQRVAQRLIGIYQKLNPSNNGSQ